MGKKLKTGQARRDKFYRLAKETGYRSRAAFKLIQLNRKFNFLQRSRVLIDLCAAPGGWLQVASQYMPVSSVVIGVDLVAIKPIPRCMTFREDITTTKCRARLKEELKTWKADCVLHDGAPNVGQNWTHDAFEQNRLTLSALALAVEFLVKNGTFVTKIFRSKDYPALLQTFGKLFRKVHATKPPASRQESAEIFVVCEGFYAPNRIDKNLLDARHVFDTDPDESKKTDAEKRDEARATLKQVLQRQDGFSRKHADGYDENKPLYATMSASSFVRGDRFEDALLHASEIVFEPNNTEDEFIRRHVLTSNEVVSSCADLKVLGKREVKLLILWRKKLRKLLNISSSKKDAEVDTNDTAKDVVDGEEAEDLKLEAEIEHLKQQERLELKRKRKNEFKQKQKLETRRQLEIDLPNDKFDLPSDTGLFSLKKVKGSMLNGLHDASTNINMDGLEDAASDGGFDLSDDDNDEAYLGDDGAKKAGRSGSNPLLVEFESSADKAKRIADLWYSKPIFTQLAARQAKQSAEEAEFTKVSSNAQRVKETFEKKTEAKENGHSSTDVAAADALVNMSDDEDFDEVYDDVDDAAAKERRALDAASDDEDTSSDDDDDEEEADAVRDSESKAKTTKKPTADYQLRPDDLALAEAMITSRKKRREIIDSGFHRYNFNEDPADLPDWFREDEEMHMRRPIEVERKALKKYRNMYEKDVNARTIKKVAEAKARKKKRVMRKLDKAKQKAEHVLDAEGVPETEKAFQVRSIYRKALGKQKPKTTVMVSKRGGGSAASKKQRGNKTGGRVKMVDPRMKKDRVGEKKKAAGKAGKKSGKKGKSGKKAAFK